MKHQALFSLKDKSKTVMVLSAVVFVWSIKGRQLAKIVYDFRLVSNPFVYIQ